MKTNKTANKTNEKESPIRQNYKIGQPQSCPKNNTLNHP